METLNRHSSKRVVRSVFALSALLCWGPLGASTDPAEVRLDPSTPDDQLFFGSAVAVDGEWAAVGAWRDDEVGNDAGAVFMYQKTSAGWEFSQKLTDPSGIAFDRFGEAIDIEGDRLVVGAPRRSVPANDAGEVLIFKLNGSVWEFEFRFNGATFGSGPPAIGANHRLGTSVAINTYDPEDCPGANPITNVVAGAPFVNGGNFAGAILVAELQGINWFERGRFDLPANDVLLRDALGWSVDLTGDWIAAGAPESDSADPFDAVGAVVLYRRQGVLCEYGEQTTLNGDIGENNRFGSIVKMDGGNNPVVLVGAPDEDNAFGTDAGAVYLFSNLLEMPPDVQKINNNDTSGGDKFGFGIDIFGDDMVVGAPFNTEGSFDSGAAYWYHEPGAGWEFVQKLVPSNASFDDEFGSAVSVAEFDFLIGAPDKDVSPNFDSGAAYVLDSSLIFTDGFESGDVSAWTSSSP